MVDFGFTSDWLRMWREIFYPIGSFRNDKGDGNRNATNLHILWAKTVALHALHVRFSFVSIALPSSAKQQREITKFEVGGRQYLEVNFSFFLSNTRGTATLFSC